MHTIHGVETLYLPQKSNAEHPIYPSTIISTSPMSPSLLPSHLHPSHPLPPPPCIEFPLPHSRLEPGEGVGASLVLQGQGGNYSEEELWNLVFYYEPALITVNSRIRCVLWCVSVLCIIIVNPPFLVLKSFFCKSAPPLLRIFPVTIIIPARVFKLHLLPLPGSE